jgi:hypothetical protein
MESIMSCFCIIFVSILLFPFDSKHNELISGPPFGSAEFTGWLSLYFSCL